MTLDISMLNSIFLLYIVQNVKFTSQVLQCSMLNVIVKKYSLYKILVWMLTINGHDISKSIGNFFIVTLLLHREEIIAYECTSHPSKINT